MELQSSLQIEYGICGKYQLQFAKACLKEWMKTELFSINCILTFKLAIFKAVKTAFDSTNF
jgi:hypothetical protein